MNPRGAPKEYLFKKGQPSANPGGRPKEAISVRNLAREHTQEAIETLVRCMREANEKTQVQAAQALLDRGWGRPEQHVELAGEGLPLALQIVYTNDWKAPALSTDESTALDLMASEGPLLTDGESK